MMVAVITQCVAPQGAAGRGQQLQNAVLVVLLALGLIGAGRETSAQTPPRITATSNLKRLSVEELMNVDVTSVSKRTEPLRDAPASIFVISSDDIRRSGATNLPDVLRLAPNLQVARVDPVQYAISARGFNNAIGNKLLVLIDGRTVYTPLFSGVFWDQQDLLLEDIERIEVISGPGATLWGANAVNGVINVITKSSSETRGALLAGGVGSTERGVALRWGGAVRSASYRAYAKFSDWDNTKLANGSAIRNDWHRSQAGMRADWSAAAGTITVQGDAYTGESEHRGFFGLTELPPVEVAGVNLLTRWTRQLESGSDVQLQAYFDHATRDDFVLFRPEADTFDIEFQQGIPRGPHKVLWGGGYRHARDQMDPALFLRFIPPDRRLNWENVFVQGELRLSEHVSTTIGTKLENNDYTGLEYLPSVRVAWKPSDNRLAWGAGSRAVRAPSRIDREVFAPMNPPFFVVGGPDFESEVANVFELGYRAQASTTLSYSITGFAHVWDKLRSTTAVPVIIENKIEGTVYGVEVWGTYQPFGFWTLNAGSMYLNEELRLEPGSTDPVGARNSSLRNDPDYQWMARSSIDLPAHLELDFHLRGVGSLPNPSVPGYTEFDIRVGWRLRPNVEIAVTGHDLLHSDHPEFGALAGRNQIERRVFGKIRLGL